MRYASGLSLPGGLRAAVVTDEEIRDGIAAVAETLRRFTPHVESPASGDAEPGVFWLDARGLERLFGSLETWAFDAHLSRLSCQATVQNEDLTVEIPKYTIKYAKEAT